MKKCPKTLSGKHIWGEKVDGWEKMELAFTGAVVGVPKFVKVCVACGMVDDSESMKSKKKGKKI